MPLTTLVTGISEFVPAGRRRKHGFDDTLQIEVTFPTWSGPAPRKVMQYLDSDGTRWVSVYRAGDVFMVNARHQPKFTVTTPFYSQQPHGAHSRVLKSIEDLYRHCVEVSGNLVEIIPEPTLCLDFHPIARVSLRRPSLNALRSSGFPILELERAVGFGRLAELRQRAPHVQGLEQFEVLDPGAFRYDHDTLFTAVAGPLRKAYFEALWTAAERAGLARSESVQTAQRCRDLSIGMPDRNKPRVEPDSLLRPYSKLPKPIVKIVSWSQVPDRFLSIADPAYLAAISTPTAAAIDAGGEPEEFSL